MMGQVCRSDSLFYYFRTEDHLPENHLLMRTSRDSDKNTKTQISVGEKDTWVSRQRKNSIAVCLPVCFRRTSCPGSAAAAFCLMVSRKRVYLLG